MKYLLTGLVIIIFLTVLGLTYFYLRNQSPLTKNPETNTTATQSVKVPNAISTLFTNVNQALNTNISPTRETEFYSMQGFIKKNSWKLDLTEALAEKTKLSALFSVLDENLEQDLANAADGPGQSVQGYQNDQIYCFLLRGINQSDSLSCIKK